MDGSLPDQSLKPLQCREVTSESQKLCQMRNVSGRSFRAVQVLQCGPRDGLYQSIVWEGTWVGLKKFITRWKLQKAVKTIPSELERNYNLHRWKEPPVITQTPDSCFLAKRRECWGCKWHSLRWEWRHNSAYGSASQVSWCSEHWPLKTQQGDHISDLAGGPSLVGCASTSVIPGTFSESRILPSPAFQTLPYPRALRMGSKIELKAHRFIGVELNVTSKTIKWNSLITQMKKLRIGEITCLKLGKE